MNKVELHANRIDAGDSKLTTWTKGGKLVDYPTTLVIDMRGCGIAPQINTRCYIQFAAKTGFTIKQCDYVV